MSAFGKGTRCDTCGKFSKNHTTGEYTRKDGSAGYIWPEENELPEGRAGKDICDDCLESQREVDDQTVRSEVRAETFANTFEELQRATRRRRGTLNAY